MTDPAPSSLSPEAAQAKANIVAHMQPDGAYWRGDAALGLTGAELQQEFQDLLRAEQLGEADKIGPAHGIDADLPPSVSNYSLEGLPIYSSEDRVITDAFLSSAHEFGLGQAHAIEAIRFALTFDMSRGAEALVTDFIKFAMSRGFSDEQIEFATKWAADYDERGGAAPAPAKKTEAAPKSAADELAEITKLCGDPRSEYWRGPKAAQLQARMRELIAGG